MRVVGVALLVLVASCYQSPAAGLSCKIRCTEGCPSGMTCTQGFCAASGVTCSGAADSGVDGAATCGATGMACCSAGPACVTNTHCVSGTCQECATSVGLGRHHTCAVKRDGTVWCSGNNESGQLGDGGATGTSTAVQVVDATGPITDASAVSAGNGHSCAVRAGGAAWCWGYGAYGQLGNNLFTSSPVAVQVLTTAGTPLSGVAELTTGSLHTCALDTTGGIWCWGYNGSGQLSDGSVANRGRAARVLNSSFQPFAIATSMSIGAHHSCLVDGSAQLWCWGDGTDGRIGDNGGVDRYTPVMIMTGARSVAAGRRHTCAVRMDGTTACWGGGFRGWLGNGELFPVYVPTTVLVAKGGAAFEGAAKVTASGASCAIMTDQHVYCWGYNAHGQAGNGAGGPIPGQVTYDDGTPLSNVDRLTAGFAHVCARRTNGELLCWGRNIDGEMGDGTTISQGFPTPYGLSCP